MATLRNNLRRESTTSGQEKEEYQRRQGKRGTKEKADRPRKFGCGEGGQRLSQLEKGDTLGENGIDLHL